MDDNAKLRKSLIRNFLLSIVIIGIAQIFMGIIFGYLINPLLEKLLSMDGLLTSKDVRGTFSILFQGFLIFIVQKLTSGGNFWSGVVVNEFLSKIFDISIIDNMSSLNQNMSGLQVFAYLSKILLMFLIMVAIWLLPYIATAIFFSVMVSKRVAALEKKRIERDREYERKRNLLLSDMAHDIKTPITTVAGFSKAMADGDVAEEKMQEYLNAVYVKSMQISDLVNLLFDFVKLDSSGFELTTQSEDLCEVLRECIVRLYTDFELKKMELDIDIPDEEYRFPIDKTQFERAINNILINTLRHNPEGTPVYVELLKEESYLYIRISDYGKTIERETAEHLFEPFVQGDKSRKTGAGSGLGLSISKKIIEMHGGQIRLIQYNNPEKYQKVKTFEIKFKMGK